MGRQQDDDEQSQESVWLRLLRSLYALGQRWLRRPANRVRLVTGSTVLSLGLVLLLVVTADRTEYWFRSEPQTGTVISLPPVQSESADVPTPDVALTIGPEQSPSATPSPRTPSPSPAEPAGSAPRPRPRPAAPSTPGRPDSSAPAPKPSASRPAQPAKERCAVTISRSGSWDQGYVATVVLRNLGDRAVNGWTLGWRFGADQQIRNLWNGQANQNGRQVQVRDAGWNASIAPGASVQLGFEATAAPTRADPNRFTLNGARCA